jgi:hypothetical protein
MKRLTAVMACVVLGLGSCASRSGTPTDNHGRLLQVLVSVYAFNDARVRAVLIDGQGRRTGWNVDRPIREIPGVLNGYGTEEGIPDEDAPVDTTTLAPADTVPVHPEPTPKYYYLSLQDSSGVPSLLHDGECELRLDPVAAGHVTLTLTGTGVGFGQCQDTTSVTVRAGVPSRWWLRWNATEGRCTVAISRMSGIGPKKSVR